jgi:hypothetical protein
MKYMGPSPIVDGGPGVLINPMEIQRLKAELSTELIPELMRH